MANDSQKLAADEVAPLRISFTCSLDELLQQIAPENLHSETDWGDPVGNEVW
jgi:antitoxin component of MazEF toxin-antitoxin module